MGSSQADRAVDDPNLAVRLDHRGICVLNALQVVSSGSVAIAVVSAVLSGLTQQPARIMR